MNFATAFERVLGAEGAYSNDPNDPGGETKWGISKRSYPMLDIATLTKEQAQEVYRHDFWERVHADELPSAVAFQAFDFAVNSGIETAIRYLQRAVGVADDGHWGPVTRAAAAGADPAGVVVRLLAARLDYMTHLTGWTYFGRGWVRRISADLNYGATDLQGV